MTAVGSSFLVGRTYTTGYRTLLAPDFLTDVGALGRLVVPGHDGLRTATVDGRAVTLVSRTHQLGPSDVDEHGRPVVLVYGFVSVTPLDRPDPGDLERARVEALAAYHRARARDDQTHEVSVPFALSSTVVPAVAPSPPAPPVRRYPLIAVTAVAVLALVAGGWMLWRPAAAHPWTGTWQSANLTVTLDCPSRCMTAAATQPSGCRYDLTDPSGSGGSLTFWATPTGDGCLPAGTVTLKQTSDTTATLRWYADEHVVLDADLSRAAG